MENFEVTKNKIQELEELGEIEERDTEDSMDGGFSNCIQATQTKRDESNILTNLHQRIGKSTSVRNGIEKLTE